MSWPGQEASPIELANERGPVGALQRLLTMQRKFKCLRKDKMASQQEDSRPSSFFKIGLSGLAAVLLATLSIASAADGLEALKSIGEHHHHKERSVFHHQAELNDNNNYNFHQSADFSETNLPLNGNNNADSSHQHDLDYYYPESALPNNHANNNNHDLFHGSFSTLNHLNRMPDKEYLSHDLAEKACHLDRGCQRKDRLNNTYLSNCSRYKLENLLSNEILMSIMHDSSDGCYNLLDEFIQLDEVINQFDQLFKNLLTRYNCHNGYSVKWSCDDCKKSYKDWLCATSLPYYMNGERIKPCISFCERVEQRCPYLHPITKEQYGGQPVFICRDPNIPFVPEITPDIPYSEPSKCYDLCHLSDNLTELEIDSLSKYDYEKCPDKGLIAEEVRSDPLYCKLDLNQQQELFNRSKISPLGDPYNPNEYNSNDAYGSNETNPDDQTKSINLGHPTSKPSSHVHNQKLIELRERLAVYKSQPKTHKFRHYSEHSSADRSPSQMSKFDEGFHHQSVWSEEN